MKKNTPVIHPAPGGPVTARIQTDAGLLLMVVIWAVNFSIIKVVLDDLTPLALNALRFPVASVVVWAALRWRGPLPLPERRDVPRILLLGLVGNVVYQMFFIFGADRTRAGNASLLLAITPILVAVGSAAIGHERLQPRVWLGVLATIAGIALVVAGGSQVGLGQETLAGDLILIVASVAWSIYTIGSRPMVERYGSIPVTAWTLWSGTIVLFLAGIPDLLSLRWSEVPGTTWLGVVYAGGLAIGLAYIIWNQGIRVIGSTRTATYSNLVPVLALVVAWFMLGEVPSLWQAVGAAVIIGGVSLARGDS
ncbi:MAG TPA: DMT family transporter [Longimicrobiales bacterium]|nr:DMT family transporter [Longimicrobiales bacterium]